MNLQELALQISEEYNPKDKPTGGSGFEHLPDGSYDVVVEKAGHRVYESGYDAVAITLKVLTGDQVNKEELIDLDVDSQGIHQFVLKKNIQMIQQFAYVTDTQLTEADWISEDAIGAALVSAVGKQLILHVETTTSKKGKEYVNYSFEKYPEDTLDFSGEDEDIPF